MGQPNGPWRLKSTGLGQCPDRSSRLPCNDGRASGQSLLNATMSAPDWAAIPSTQNRSTQPPIKITKNIATRSRATSSARLTNQGPDRTATAAGISTSRDQCGRVRPGRLRPPYLRHARSRGGRVLAAPQTLNLLDVVHDRWPTERPCTERDIEPTRSSRTEAADPEGQRAQQPRAGESSTRPRRRMVTWAGRATTVLARRKLTRPPSQVRRAGSGPERRRRA